MSHTHSSIRRTCRATALRHRLSRRNALRYVGIPATPPAEPEPPINPDTPQNPPEPPDQKPPGVDDPKPDGVPPVREPPQGPAPMAMWLPGGREASSSTRRAGRID